MKNKTILLLVGVIILCVFGFKYLNTDSTKKLGSIDGENAYQSVVTAPLLQTSGVLRSSWGILGSVIITGAGAGTFTLYDASTTNSALRTISATSSLRQLASFPASAAANTYTFDEVFYNGLVVEFLGAQGTTTITWRQ